MEAVGLIGIAVVAGIYFWDRRRKRDPGLIATVIRALHSARDLARAQGNEARAGDMARKADSLEKARSYVGGTWKLTPEEARIVGYDIATLTEPHAIGLLVGTALNQHWECRDALFRLMTLVQKAHAKRGAAQSQTPM